MFSVKVRDNDTATADSSWNDSDVSSLDKDESSDDEAQLEEELSSTEALHRSILSERAALLMHRESSVTYCPDAYRSNDISEDISRLSLGSLSPDVQDKASMIEDGTIDPIDLTCRTKMMEWSIKVVEFSYPPPSYSSSFIGRKRKHSIETLRIVSAAFSYVDRVMARSIDQPSIDDERVLRVQTRSDYKLLCMISVHLAAKMSGLFSRGDHDYLESLRSEDDKQEKCMKVSASESSICTATTTCSSANSFKSEGKADSNSTCAHSSQVLSQEIPLHTLQPRPLLHLVSYKGLYTLCQGEFSIEGMFQMELSILSTLDWRLNGGLVLEWLCLMMESCIYCQSYGCNDLEHVNLEEVKEITLVQLEAILVSCKPMTVRPSVLVLAACTTAVTTCMPIPVHDDELFLLALSFTRVLDITFDTEEFEDALSILKY